MPPATARDPRDPGTSSWLLPSMLTGGGIGFIQPPAIKLAPRTTKAPEIRYVTTETNRSARASSRGRPREPLYSATTPQPAATANKTPAITKRTPLVTEKRPASTTPPRRAPEQP